MKMINVFFLMTSTLKLKHIFWLYPKIPVTDFNDFISKADKEMIKYFLKKLMKLCKELGLLDSGFRLVTNNGKDANQGSSSFSYSYFRWREI